jgi:hypothetical protein
MSMSANPDDDFVSETTARIDHMLGLAERNGWNAAINAVRTILPFEYSQKIRALYKRPEDDPSTLPASREGGE